MIYIPYISFLTGMLLLINGDLTILKLKVFLSSYRIAGNFRGVLIFVIFVTIPRVTKFSTHEFFHPRIFSRLLTSFAYRASGVTKFKTTKINSEDPRQLFTKICTPENYPLYGRWLYITYLLLTMLILRSQYDTFILLSVVCFNINSIDISLSNNINDALFKVSRLLIYLTVFKTLS